MSTVAYAKIAHQVEHQTENLGVAGSSPALGTKNWTVNSVGRVADS